MKFFKTLAAATGCSGARLCADGAVATGELAASIIQWAAVLLRSSSTTMSTVMQRLPKSGASVNMGLIATGDADVAFVGVSGCPASYEGSGRFEGQQYQWSAR
jgi:TRAP-type uncharacterized transport system substrate-binding protein